MAGQSIVNKGMRWQVGNGRSIRIWLDQWTLNPSTYKLVSPSTSLPLEARVFELIEPIHGTWKADLIQSIFLPHKADEIYGIALSSKLPNDKQIWDPINNGKFTVRSAYKVVVELASNGSGDYLL